MIKLTCPVIVDEEAIGAPVKIGGPGKTGEVALTDGMGEIEGPVGDR
jgi:hypothetical protein